MRILQMYPKDITFICEFTLSDLAKLRTAMDMITVNFDQTIPEEVEAKDFLVDNFVKFLEETIKGATDGT